MRNKTTFWVIMCMICSMTCLQSMAKVKMYNISTSLDIPMYYEMCREDACAIVDAYLVADTLATDTIVVSIYLTYFPDDKPLLSVRMSERSKARKIMRSIKTDIRNDSIIDIQWLRGSSKPNFNLIHQQEIKNIIELSKKITKEEADKMKEIFWRHKIVAQFTYCIVPKYN